MRVVYVMAMILGFAYAILSLFMFTWLFYMAYFAEGQTIYIAVNNLGEANLEFWLLIVLFPLSIFFCLISAKILFEEEILR